MAVRVLFVVALAAAAAVVSIATSPPADAVKFRRRAQPDNQLGTLVATTSGGRTDSVLAITEREQQFAGNAGLSKSRSSAGKTTR